MGTPTNVDNPYKIPGAILFMTLTFKEGTEIGGVKIEKGKQDMNVVAYDPKLKNNETLDVIKARYANEAFPYFERFSAPGGAPALFQTVGTGGVYFVGAFGGKDKESPKSNTWAQTVAGSHVINGLTLVYWNQKVTETDIRQGMYTAPAHGRFTSHAKATIMSVFSGPGAKLGASGMLGLLQAEKLQLHYYATHDGENLNLRP